MWLNIDLKIFKITTYLGKRDYIDYNSDIEPIDGVILIDPEYVKDRKVYAHVLAAFRYGREDLDVLGLTFRKDLFIAQQQCYPKLNSEPSRPLTHLQQRLLRKLGPNAYPFFFQVLNRQISFARNLCCRFFYSNIDTQKCARFGDIAAGAWWHRKSNLFTISIPIWLNLNLFKTCL